MERISYILGIYKALRILLPTEKMANAWLSKPNQAPLFSGNSALDKLMKGHVIDLADVRRYLDAERGCKHESKTRVGPCATKALPYYPFSVSSH